MFEKHTTAVLRALSGVRCKYS